MELSTLKDVIDERDKDVRLYHRQKNANVLESSKIIEDMTKKNKYVLYGGMALDFTVRKLSKDTDNIYPDKDELPDWDLFVNGTISVSEKICDKLNKKFPMSFVHRISAIHRNTVRIYIDFEPLIDLTEVDADILNYYRKYSTNINGILCLNPKLLQKNLLKPYVYGIEGLVYRADKDLKRIIKLQKYSYSDMLIQTSDIYDVNISSGAGIGSLSTEILTMLIERLPKNFIFTGLATMCGRRMDILDIVTIPLIEFVNMKNYGDNSDLGFILGDIFDSCSHTIMTKTTCEKPYDNCHKLPEDYTDDEYNVIIHKYDVEYSGVKFAVIYYEDIYCANNNYVAGKVKDVLDSKKTYNIKKCNYFAAYRTLLTFYDFLYRKILTKKQLKFVDSKLAYYSLNNILVDGANDINDPDYYPVIDFNTGIKKNSWDDPIESERVYLPNYYPQIKKKVRAKIKEDSVTVKK